MIADDVAITAIDAIAASGGDVTQPTVITDQNTGAAVAVVKQLPSGSIYINDAPKSADIGSAVNGVIGFIDNLAGTITNIGTQVKRIGNAVQGGAVGAQTGYNAPIDWKPIILGGLGVGVGLWALGKVLR